MRPFLAVLAALAALPLLAQTSLIGKAVAKNPKNAEAHYLLGSVISA